MNDLEHAIRIYMFPTQKMKIKGVFYSTTSITQDKLKWKKLCPV